MNIEEIIATFNKSVEIKRLYDFLALYPKCEHTLIETLVQPGSRRTYCFTYVLLHFDIHDNCDEWAQHSQAPLNVKRDPLSSHMNMFDLAKLGPMRDH